MTDLDTVTAPSNADNAAGHRSSRPRDRIVRRIHARRRSPEHGCADRRRPRIHVGRDRSSSCWHSRSSASRSRSSRWFAGAPTTMDADDCAVIRRGRSHATVRRRRFHDAADGRRRRSRGLAYRLATCGSAVICVIAALGPVAIVASQLVGVFGWSLHRIARLPRDGRDLRHDHRRNPVHDRATRRRLEDEAPRQGSDLRGHRPGADLRARRRRRQIPRQTGPVGSGTGADGPNPCPQPGSGSRADEFDEGRAAGQWDWCAGSVGEDERVGRCGTRPGAGDGDAVAMHDDRAGTERLCLGTANVRRTREVGNRHHHHVGCRDLAFRRRRRGPGRPAGGGTGPLAASHVHADAHTIHPQVERRIDRSLRDVRVVERPRCPRRARGSVRRPTRNPARQPGCAAPCDSIRADSNARSIGH